ncbi:MAG: Ribonuclease [Devosia sp.]|nr:Ribonuclease [Devosia sp.]
MNGRGRNHQQLEARLGYRFADPDLLDRALTHSSAISPGKRVERSYQRLEFLGDRVLGLIVADLLYRKRPKSNEGDLNRSFVTLVRKESCAAIARDLNLGEEMYLGESEARTGGMENEAILADIAEAVIGAVYCDGGLGRAYEMVERLLGDQVDQAINLRPDAKTTLQEWAQGRGLDPPTYVEVERRGPQHAPEFTIAVKLENFEPIDANGPSKRIAEHKAAERFLVREGVWEDIV